MLKNWNLETADTIEKHYFSSRLLKRQLFEKYCALKQKSQSNMKPNLCVTVTKIPARTSCDVAPPQVNNMAWLSENF